MNRDLLFLNRLACRGDAALLVLRLITANFLIRGVWDNITEPARMAEFAGFLSAHGFPAPELLAPFSVWTQFLAAVLLVPGLLTRWAGLIILVTFIVGTLMVHAGQDSREQWPAVALIGIGFVFATIGAGRFSADAWLQRRRG